LAWKGELDQIPEADWKLAARRERIIAPLADRDHVTQSEIEQAGEALRLGPAMVFRLLARYRRKRCTSVLVPETRGRKCGSRVLDPSLEKIIETAIKDFYLRREKPSLASLHREVRQACHKAGVTPPSYKAIQSRVRDFDPREVITRRMGPKQAAQLLSPVKAGLHVKEPQLERWLTLQITGIYHRSIHRGLGRTPQQAWNQAMKSQAQVRMPHSEQQFYVDFLPCQRRAIRRDGIRIFNIFYWTDSLTTFLHRSRNVCAVHYDPRDLSRV